MEETFDEFLKSPEPRGSQRSIQKSRRIRPLELNISNNSNGPTIIDLPSDSQLVRRLGRELGVGSGSALINSGGNAAGCGEQDRAVRWTVSGNNGEVLLRWTVLAPAED